jgi:hypothetical protein
MTTIYKWTLTPGSTGLHMPAGAKVLTVQMQGDQPQLWALVDPEQPKEWRTFEIHGTGHPMPTNPGEYVATFQMHGGALVWHVFEATNAA